MHILVEDDDGRPLRILDARGYHWTFDDAGRIDEDLRNSLIDRMDAFDKAERGMRMRVVDLVPEIKKHELLAKLEWTLSAEDLDRIAADLWPGIHGPAPDVTTVKGKAPRKPALTNDARYALQRLNGYVNAIKNELQNPSERALKGLAFEALRTGLWEDEVIWRVVADFAKQAEAIRAAHRTGRGEWYAVVEVARVSRDYAYLFEEIAVAHEKCPSRQAAVEAGRKLMAEKVDWVGADIEVADWQLTATIAVWSLSMRR